MLLPAAVLALGLGGLPLTGGALAKLAIKGTLGDGVVGTLATLSAIASTVLMIHFLHRLSVDAPQDLQRAAPIGFVLPWLVIAFAAVVLPWALYSRSTAHPCMTRSRPRSFGRHFGRFSSADF